MSKATHHYFGVLPDPAALSDLRLRRLYDLWQTRRGSRAMPARADFLAEEFAPWMPHLALYEVEPEPFRLKVRLSGLAVVKLDGCDLTGRYLDEGISPDEFPFIFDTYRECAERAMPFYHHVEVDSPDWEYDVSGTAFRYFRKLLLPLSGGGGRVDMILAALYAEINQAAEDVSIPLRLVVTRNGFEPN